MSSPLVGCHSSGSTSHGKNSQPCERPTSVIEHTNEMTTPLLSRRVGCIRNPTLASIRSYHIGKASSVNSAIYHGLRKSNGLAFRGKKVAAEGDLREKYRIKHGIPEYEPPPKAGRRPPSSNAGASRTYDREDTRNGRSAGRELNDKQGGSGHDHELANKLRESAQVYLRRSKRNSSAPYARGPWEKKDPFESTTKPWIRPNQPQRPDSSSYTNSTERRQGRVTTEAPPIASRSLDRSIRPEISEPIENGTGNNIPISRSWMKPVDKFIPKLEPIFGSDSADKRSFDRKPFGSREEAPRERFASRESSGPRFSRGTSSQEGQRENASDASPPARAVKDGLPLALPYTTPASQFLYGTSVVQGALLSKRRKLYKMYIYTGENRDGTNRDLELEKLAHRASVEVVKVGQDFLRVMDKMSAGRPHNGYILEASPLPQLPVRSLGKVITSPRPGFEVELGYQSREEAAVNGTDPYVDIPPPPPGLHPFVLLLDSIVDPGNLGGILRTASFLGVSAVAISVRNSAPFSPVVLKASAGATEDMTIMMIHRPEGFIVDSKRAGWKIYAAVAPFKKNDPAIALSLSTDSLGAPLTQGPCILMLGSEGEGLRWNLRSKADVDLYIEGAGFYHSVDSLNVSVAAGILCNAFLRETSVTESASVPTTEPVVETPFEPRMVGELF